MQTVDIYIDTSIKGPRRRDGICQYIIAYKAANGETADTGNKIRATDTTENSLTLIGLEAALKRLKASCQLILHLECQHVAAVLNNGWMTEWKYNNWMTKKGAPVADAEKWQSVEYLLNAHEFEVRLKEPHTYRDWMKRTLSEKENESSDGKR